MVFIGAFLGTLLTVALCSPMQGGAAHAARTLELGSRVIDQRAPAWCSPRHTLCTCRTQSPCRSLAVLTGSMSVGDGESATRVSRLLDLVDERDGVILSGDRLACWDVIGYYVMARTFARCDDGWG
jgi:hypothetical protein